MQNAKFRRVFTVLRAALGLCVRDEQKSDENGMKTAGLSAKNCAMGLRGAIFTALTARLAADTVPLCRK